MIERTEIDGVPTFVAPLAGNTMHAGLIFRVGRADETLATAGITHLIEHLALHQHGVADYHYNGATDVNFTHFHVSGSETDILSYLDGVTSSLANLPMARFETEKMILRTEAAGRGRGANHDMPLWRYGARGHGLVSYAEFGLLRLTEQEVFDWCGHWFTRENAVLWIAGKGVPAGLRLPLPSGRRMPAPAVTSALPTTPAYFCGGNGKIVFDAIVPRGAAAQIYCAVLERELFRALRQEGGYSYTAATDYSSRGDGFATVTALADALPDKQDAMVGGFFDVLAKLNAGRIDDKDISAVVAKAEESLSHPDAVAGILPGYAMNVLTGLTPSTLDELRAKLRAVTAEQVHEVAREAMRTGLVQVPERHRPDWAGFEAAPTGSAQAVTGITLKLMDSNDCSVVIGHEGISWVAPGHVATVRHSDCVAMLSWPDGARRLYGGDGINVDFEPTLFPSHAEALAILDAAVPPSLIIDMPARQPEDIPKPKGAKASASASAATKPGPAAIFGAVVAALIFLPLVCFGGLGTLGIGSDPQARGDAANWIFLGVVWLLAFGAAVPVYRVLKRYRAATR